MKQLCVAYLGVLLLAFYLTAQVTLARNNSTAGNSTTSVSPTNASMNTTGPAGTGCGRTAAFTLLVPPLSLTAFFLHSWS